MGAVYTRIMVSGLNLERALNLAQHLYRRVDVSMVEAREVAALALVKGLDVLESEVIDKGKSKEEIER
jgi:hypothetical protein